MRESAIATAEAILRKSPQSVTNIDSLIQVLTESISYDPNYCGDDIDSDEGIVTKIVSKFVKLNEFTRV